MIAELHARLPRSVLAITGGGAGVLGQLLALPGGSRWLLEAVIPYSAGAMSEFLGQPPIQACSRETADAMARRALDRARWLAPGETVLGLGCTASLASDRPKKGEHRVHLTLMTDRRTSQWSLTLAKRARDRAAEEEVVDSLILHALAEVAGLEPLPSPLLPEDVLEVIHTERETLHLTLESPLHLNGDGRLVLEPTPARGSVPALLPGASIPCIKDTGRWRGRRRNISASPWRSN